MRIYSNANSGFDPASTVNGLAWSSGLGKWFATALTTNGSQDWMESSTTGDSGWGLTGFPVGGSGFPISPSNLYDVIVSSDSGRVWVAGAKTTPGSIATWFSVLGANYSALSWSGTSLKTITAAVCSANGFSTVVVGSELVSGSGQLFGQLTGSAVSVSTTIDNQPFRVTQIAWNPVGNILVASLLPVGSVSTTRRVMASFDVGASWVTRSTSLDGAAAYGVCWSNDLGLFVVTGDTTFVTSPDASTWTTHAAPAGVHVAGKPCDANGTIIMPGGSTNDLTEWDGMTATPTTLTGATTLNVASYSPDLDQVLVGGTGTIPVWAGVPFVGPEVNVEFDLG